VSATDPRDAILVLTTLPTASAARALVRTLVDRRLVACGTVVGGVTSIYRWEGKVEESAEVQVLLKTRRGRWDDLQQAMTELHPYDVPEVLGLTIASGLQAYLDWVGSETTESEGGGA
jgi:periplasmic divalent cation tolerance protein